MYIQRITDSLLEEYLDTFGAVLIEGPKWCGKTTSAARVAASELRIADPANNYQNRRLAELNVSAALAGEKPRLIDEWQEVPATWDAVRYECDQAGGAPGQFLLTGSATPREAKKPVHSGAGRISSLRMDTLTLQELGVSSGEVSLGGLFVGLKPSGLGRMTLESIADRVCRGGWPAAVNLTTQQAMRIARSYIEAVASEDLEKMDGVARDPAKVRRLIASLARNESTLATKKTIVNDTAENSGGAIEKSIAESTVSEYSASLKKIFFIDDVPAWNPALRSPVRIRAAAKRHLADPSLVAAALGASPDTLMADLKTLGFLFESLVIHDLKVYARAMEAQVMHYRDDSNLEVDAIVATQTGEWGAFEIKLGAAQEEEAAANLRALERKMVERGERPPACKVALIGIGGVAYLREDGVAVVPIDVLGA